MKTDLEKAHERIQRLEFLLDRLLHQVVPAIVPKRMTGERARIVREAAHELAVSDEVAQAEREIKKRDRAAEN